MYPQKNIFILLLFFFFQFGSKAAKPAAFAPDGRQNISLNQDWQFYFSYNFEQGIKKQPVNLPHTWNAAEVLEGVADYKRTSAVYEKNIEVKKEWAGKRLFLYFEGVNNVAAIFVNRKMLAEHKGGYTGFAVEITDAVKAGQNSIMVQVSNAYRLDVIPLHGDFNSYGGIHRPVSLLVTAQNCITPLDYGSPGVYLRQKEVSGQMAKIEVFSKLSLKTTAGLQLKTTIYDAAKQEIISSLSPVKEAEVLQNLQVEKPHLWNAKADPYLYQVQVQLLQDQKVIDEVWQPLGLRYFSVDPNKGFFLNGKYLDLYGVGRHEDVSGKGSALSDQDQELDMTLIRELGATAVRLTHYPHSKRFYELCDQNGLILWSEIPFVGPGGYTGAGYVRDAELENNIRQSLTELIRQNYNHPSVCFWGLFNELNFKYDDPVPFIASLNELAKKEDPGRLTTLASNLGTHEFTTLTDLMAWNKYMGWYGGDFQQIGSWADQVHQALPLKPIAISEYGAGASPFKHTEELTAPVAKGPFHPEEWQTAFHEKHWSELKKRPFIWGKFIWVLADFGSSIRTEGDEKGMNDKGLVTYDRKIKKDAFYFYKANWNPQPMLYIAERRNTERKKNLCNIKVFSNLKNVMLWVNGKPIGKQNPDEMNTLHWNNILLGKGHNKILVKGTVDGKTLTDSCTWALK
ncbi:glycoside hydrolase family 2 protein [Pedobacter nutrimenti]|uniref:Beta-galactosidase n=1 Tax=Pedobacter nutrimenti TaxID=1241337 RepID=A0A318UHY8_9SPHI|nr:glycoside hydrolase family 2 TIM barrel-domain containing protein [Pedobacter nutrimenti]PYF75160.1 beta-galactosidase [Pedobacter nutrimenti]